MRLVVFRIGLESMLEVSAGLGELSFFQQEISEVHAAHWIVRIPRHCFKESASRILYLALREEEVSEIVQGFSMGWLKSKHTFICNAGLLSMAKLLQKTAATEEQGDGVRLSELAKSIKQLFVNQLK
jgi:hypothetical protein